MSTMYFLSLVLLFLVGYVSGYLFGYSHSTMQRTTELKEINEDHKIHNEWLRNLLEDKK